MHNLHDVLSELFTRGFSKQWRVSWELIEWKPCINWESKKVMTFFYTSLLLVFRSMQQYMFAELYWLIVNLVTIHETKPYLLNNMKFLNSSPDFGKSRYFNDKKKLIVWIRENRFGENHYHIIIISVTCKYSSTCVRFVIRSCENNVVHHLLVCCKMELRRAVQFWRSGPRKYTWC